MFKRYIGVLKNHTIICASGNIQFVDGVFETESPLEQAAIEKDPFFGVKFNLVGKPVPAFEEEEEVEPDFDESPKRNGKGVKQRG